MKKICVYTCITGDYDELHEVEVIEHDVDYICFTNNDKITSKTWKIIAIENNGLDNHKLARKIKILGHDYINKHYDISVWIDADIVFRKKVSDFVKTYLQNNSIAFFKHFSRNCAYDEAKECLKRRKETKENLLKIVDFLKDENYPQKNGLYETTVFIKKHNDINIQKAMNTWLMMIKNYSKRDQLSVGYAMWKNNIKVSEIDLSVWNNEWFYFIKHNFKTDLTSCRVYFGDDNINFNYDLNIEIDYKIKENNYSFETTVIADTDIIKIEVNDVPCLRYKNLKIKGIDVFETNFYNSIKMYEEYIFYNECGIIVLFGKFKKGDKFEFSIDLEPLNKSHIFQVLEYSSYYANEYFKLKEIESSLEEKNKKTENLLEEKNKEIEILHDTLNKVLNSKSYKITMPFRYIMKKIKKNIE